MDLLQILAPLLFSVVTALVSQFFRKLSAEQKQAQGQRRRATQKAVTDAQVGVVRDLLADVPEPAKQRYIDYLLASQREDGSFPEPPIVVSPALNVPEIEKQVEEKVSPLKKRLEDIERRFPHESTVEKIASMNEAVLGIRLDNLAEAARRVEDKMLTKWDVTVVVLEILAVLGALGGLTVAILDFFLTKATP